MEHLHYSTGGKNARHYNIEEFVLQHRMTLHDLADEGNVVPVGETKQFFFTI